MFFLKIQRASLNISPLLYFLSTLAVLLSGCMVGPDYQPPTVDEKAQIQAKEYPELRYEQTDLSRWWNVFNDPILTSLINQTQQNNQNIMIALARVKEARASLSATSAGLYPSVDADGAVDWGKQRLSPPCTAEI